MHHCFLCGASHAVALHASEAAAVADAAAATLGAIRCSRAPKHEEIHEPLAEDPGDRWEPKELQSRARCNGS